MKKARAIDRRKTARIVDVKTAGVAVRAALDADDRPLRVSATAWAGSEDDRVATLAVQHVYDHFEHEAEAKKRKRSSANAATVSAQKRAKASAEHWTNEWFALAHDAHPQYGKDKLAQRARALAALGFIGPDGTKHVVADPKQRDEISVERARQFLERKRNAAA